jgi:hypothetical protein
MQNRRDRSRQSAPRSEHRALAMLDCTTIERARLARCSQTSMLVRRLTIGVVNSLGAANLSLGWEESACRPPNSDVNPEDCAKIQRRQPRTAHLRKRLAAGDPGITPDELQASLNRAEYKRRKLAEARPANVGESAMLLASLESCAGGRRHSGSLRDLREVLLILCQRPYCPTSELQTGKSAFGFTSAIDA